VALLAEWLPVTRIICSASGPRLLVIGAKLDLGLLCSTVGALVAVLLLQCPPSSPAEFRSRLALCLNIKVLQLVSGAFFNNAGKPFFTLQLPEPPEHIFIRLPAIVCAPFINGCTYFAFRKHRSRNAVPFWPKRLEDYPVV